MNISRQTYFQLEYPSNKILKFQYKKTTLEKKKLVGVLIYFISMNKLRSSIISNHK